MSGTVYANRRPPAANRQTAFCDEWAFPFNGRSEKSGIDEWKGRCHLPPSGGKLHIPHFTMNGRSHLTWAFRKIGHP